MQRCNSQAVLMMRSRMHACRLWGDVLVWGNSHKVNSAEECCNRCRNYKPPTADDNECNGTLVPGPFA